jgi:hypothetical protein
MAKVKGRARLLPPFRVRRCHRPHAASDDNGTVLSVFLLIPRQYSLFRAVAAPGLS